MSNRSLTIKRVSAGIILLSVLLCQIIVYYNCKTHKENPKVIT
jgi:hypothetical protein